MYININIYGKWNSEEHPSPSSSSVVLYFTKPTARFALIMSCQTIADIEDKMRSRHTIARFWQDLSSPDAFFEQLHTV